MPKLKKKSKKKIRLFLIFLLVIALGAILYLCSDKSIKNIFIHNNNIFTDQEIIDMADLTNYPNFFTTTGYNVKKTGKTSSIAQTVITNKKDVTDENLKNIKQVLGKGNISTNKSSTSLVDVTIIIGKDF